MEEVGERNINLRCHHFQIINVPIFSSRTDDIGKICSIFIPMKFGTQNLPCLGQLQCKLSQAPVKIDPAGVITSFTLPIRVVWGWFDNQTGEVEPHVPAGWPFSAKCHMQRVSLVLENLGRGKGFLISVPIAFPSKQQAFAP